MKSAAAPGFPLSDPAPGIIPWTLLGFILLSAVAHALAFYLFQTIYPPGSRLAPPPVQVTLLMPGTPEADALLRWVRSKDPALAAQPRKAPIPGLLALPYTPSFATVRARPAIVQPSPQPVTISPGVSGLALVRMATRPVNSAPALPPLLPTTVTFSAVLQPRAPALPLAGLHTADAAQTLQPARYLLAVTAEGKVRYLFLKDSSGDPVLDAQAADLLRSAHFAGASSPTSDALTWGFARLDWGSTAYHPESAAAAQLGPGSTLPVSGPAQPAIQPAPPFSRSPAP